jgi:hypothetical protein
MSGESMPTEENSEPYKPAGRFVVDYKEDTACYVDDRTGGIYPAHFVVDGQGNIFPKLGPSPENEDV